jgi:hypothetical protein
MKKYFKYFILVSSLQLSLLPSLALPVQAFLIAVVAIVAVVETVGNMAPKHASLLQLEQPAAQE